MWPLCTKPLNPFQAFIFHFLVSYCYAANPGKWLSHGLIGDNLAKGNWKTGRLERGLFLVATPCDE